MAELSSKPSAGRHEAIPFWRDIRVLGIIAQIVFLALVILGVLWVVNNTVQNLSDLGIGCPDGSIEAGCVFNFLRLDAQFDISESLIDYDPSDAYGRAMLVGALNTVRVSVLGILFATILGTFTGIARLSDNWLVSNIAKWYVDIMRNTPLLLQLFFLFFGVLLLLPPIARAIQPFGLPVYLSQRGINLPWPRLMPSASIWLAFIAVGLLVAGVLWIWLGRREQQTSRAVNRPLWSLLALLVIAGTGWFIASNRETNFGVLVSESLPVSEFADFEEIMLQRLGVDSLAGIDEALESGALTEEALEEAAFTICAVQGDPAEVNLTAQFRRAGIPYEVERDARQDRVINDYASGECEMYTAGLAQLANEQPTLSEEAPQALISVPEMPLRLDVPRIEGLNFAGGLKMSPNFAAILIGLTLYTGAFIAEIVRAGIQSVSWGQTEAARALGLSEAQRLRLIVLPQALRVIIPPMTSQYLNLAKNSSLAIAVGFPDLWSTAYTTLNQSGQAVQVFLIVMASYLTLSLIISFLLNWYNRRIALVER